MNTTETKKKWTAVTETLPPANVFVKVVLENGVETVDFVTEPYNENAPFQHGIVKEWRLLTNMELRLMKQIIRDSSSRESRLLYQDSENLQLGENGDFYIPQ